MSVEIETKADYSYGMKQSRSVRKVTFEQTIFFTTNATETIENSQSI
jgi:hypothetical protein